MKAYTIKTPVLCMTVVVFLDQLTKHWIINGLSYYETKTVIPGFFNLTYLMNTGAAFGFLAGEKSMWRQVFFITIAVVALIALFLAFRHYKDQGGFFVYAIGLVSGGAVGNLIDRIRFGAVVDFLDFYVKHYHFPAFNVADSAITTGVGLFFVGSLFMEKSTRAEQAPHME